MAYLFPGEQNFLNNNIFKFEDRINSQYTRFLDRPPTYTTYYKINDIESTVDTGFNNIERMLGQNSPIKFNEIKNFPIYNIDQIVIDLQNEDQGLDTDFEGEGLILPNTIQPTPNDIFKINYLNKDYIFIVTEVKYDTIKSNNFYKISFSIKSLNGEYVEDLDRQTRDKFTCIVENIGTAEKVLVREDILSQLQYLEGIYSDIANYYKILFYNKKYNVFICSDEKYKYYDRYLSEFINEFKLFNEKNKFDSIILTNEDEHPLLKQEFNNSIYGAVVKNNINKIKNNKFNICYFNSFNNIFMHYRDHNVRTLRFDKFGLHEYIREDLISKIKDPTLLDPPNEELPETPTDETPDEELPETPTTEEQPDSANEELPETPTDETPIEEEPTNETPNEELPESPTTEEQPDSANEELPETPTDETQIEEEPTNETPTDETPDEELPETPTTEERPDPPNEELPETPTTEEQPETPTDETPIEETVLTKTIINYFNNRIETVYDLDRDGLSEYTDYMNSDRETFTLIPILLFILRYQYDKFMKEK